MGDSEDDDDLTIKGKQKLSEKQRQHLEKLMAHPEKLVPIESSKEWAPSEPPEFVRFYMGSSAGAGSEVFHVYRHLRRKEMLRQEWIQRHGNEEELEKEFQERLEANRTLTESRTAKKRAKRQKRKQNKTKQIKTEEQQPGKAESSSESDTDGKIKTEEQQPGKAESSSESDTDGNIANAS